MNQRELVAAVASSGGDASMSTDYVFARYPSLARKRVFITGGATGIGAALVTAFAQQGAHVAFIDIDSHASAELAAQLANAGRARPWWQRCDVRDVPALQAAIRDAAEALGDFSVLVNNVANDDRHELDKVTPDYWDERMAVNQRPAFFAIQSIVPGMKRLGGGSIINIGSTGWQLKESGYPAYAVAKAGTHGLTRGLAKLLGVDRIRVNTVVPGWTMTPRQRQWLTPQAEQDLERNQCLPERISPEHVASMVLFLAADDSGACTAGEFKVDAGWT